MSALLVDLTSYLLGLVDYGFALLISLADFGGITSPKLCRQGWGNVSQVQQRQQELFDRIKNNREYKELHILTDDKITWGSVKEKDGLISVQKGQFRSPIAQYLPSESETCQFYRVHPKNQQPDVYIILLPATGEMGKSTRLSMARQFATKHGYGSLILTAPFYASRKPAKQQQFFLDTVSDILLQAHAIILETTMLIQYCLTQDNRKVCVSGFSWGAAMSAYACATSLAFYPNQSHRLACVPYVGSASPCVLADGVLEYGVDWKALSNNYNMESREATRLRLLRECYKMQLASFIGNQTAPREARLAILSTVYMKHDHFIRHQYTQEFLIQLQQTFQPTMSATKELLGGHAIGALLRPWCHCQTIVDAIKRLEKVE